MRARARRLPQAARIGVEKRRPRVTPASRGAAPSWRLDASSARNVTNMGTLNVSLRRFSCALAAVLSVLLLTEGPARAQAEDQAAARALFSEGRRLAESGRYAEACATFEGARKLYTSAGILLNLADCYERTGRTASAWATFGEAASVSARTNRAEEAAEGKRRQAKLESQLMRVTLRVARDISGLVIRRDGTEVPRPAWGVPVPIDGGSHE